jgi:guanine deaminase
VATDLGAGTSLSMLQTLGEAYKAAHLTGNTLSAGHAFYLASRGGAQALGDDRAVAATYVAGALAHGR